MYSIHELEAMAPADVVAIAQSMGLKKASQDDVETSIYYILDNQATATAKAEASKVSVRKNEGKRPGRKKKSDNPEQTQPAALETEQPEKKKRGRKPKAEQQESETPAPVKEETEVSAAETPAEPVKKKRGRKPKAQKEQEAAAAAEVKKNEAANKPQASDAAEQAPAQPTPEAPEGQPAAEKRKDTAFDTFFGKAKGRTFTPRGQQPEETPQPQQHQQPQQLQQPQQHQQLQHHQAQKLLPRTQQIMLQEPGANSQTPKNREQQKGKNRRQFGRQNEADTRFPSSALEGKLTIYGVLEIMPEGFGFLRSSDYNYLPSPDDIYISQQQIKQYGLRVGDVVEASVRLPLPEEKYYPMVRPISINGLPPEQIRDREKFEHLVPLFPDEKFEITKGKSANISTRIVDMFAPIGKGQRALIVAPPKTGKTILLKDIANAISENHPETYIIMLLIDERPEEVTDMARSVNAEVIASTFDEPADRHVRIAGIVLEKAKRLVESGHDVVIMLDSITRLARAYNTVSPASGKILSGGVDANALQRPKRFFGAARNIEGGGSLTIIATALTETSSKMDEVIFEEFKGTGNMELQLDRKLSNKRIFPAVDIVASSTRRDDLLLPEETLNRMWVLRNYLGDMNSLEAMEFMKKRMEMTRSNEELLVTMDR